MQLEAVQRKTDCVVSWNCNFMVINPMSITWTGTHVRPMFQSPKKWYAVYFVTKIRPRAQHHISWWEPTLSNASRTALSQCYAEWTHGVADTHTHTVAFLPRAESESTQHPSEQSYITIVLLPFEYASAINPPGGGTSRNLTWWSNRLSGSSPTILDADLTLIMSRQDSGTARLGRPRL